MKRSLGQYCQFLDLIQLKMRWQLFSETLTPWLFMFLLPIQKKKKNGLKLCLSAEVASIIQHGISPTTTFLLAALATAASALIMENTRSIHSHMQRQL